MIFGNAYLLWRDFLCNTNSNLIKPSKVLEFLIFGSFGLELENVFTMLRKALLMYHEVFNILQ